MQHKWIPAGALLSLVLILLAACQQVDTTATAMFESVQGTINAEGTATADHQATASGAAETTTAEVQETAAAATDTAIAEMTSAAQATLDNAATETAIAVQSTSTSEAATAMAAATQEAREAIQATETAGTRLAGSMIATLNAESNATALATLRAAQAEDSPDALALAAEGLKGIRHGPFSEQIPHSTEQISFWPELWLLVLNQSINLDQDEIDPNAPIFNYQNFVAEINFGNPYALTNSGWDYGLLFRISSNASYILIIFSNGDWELRFDPDIEDSSTEPLSLQAGRVPDFDNTAQGGNRIRLFVFEETGVLYINDQFAGTLNLSQHLEGGGILVATGFYVGNQQEDAVTRFEGFTVWPLPEEPGED